MTETRRIAKQFKQFNNLRQMHPGDHSQTSQSRIRPHILLYKNPSNNQGDGFEMGNNP